MEGVNNKVKVYLANIFFSSSCIRKQTITVRKVRLAKEWTPSFFVVVEILDFYTDSSLALRIQRVAFGTIRVFKNKRTC